MHLLRFFLSPRSVAAVLLLFAISLVVYTYSKPTKEEKLSSIGNKIEGLRGSLENIANKQRPTPIFEQCQISVSSATFDTYQRHSQQLVKKLGIQKAVVVTSPGQLHLLLQVQPTSKDQIMQYLATGKTFDISSLQTADPENLLDIVITEQ